MSDNYIFPCPYCHKVHDPTSSIGNEISVQRCKTQHLQEQIHIAEKSSDAETLRELRRQLERSRNFGD